MMPTSVVAPKVIEAMLAAAQSVPPGAFAELGVYKGGTAWHLAELARRDARALWLFDTFCGMPFADPIDRHQVGDFGDTSIEAVRQAIPDAVFVPGVFPASIEARSLCGTRFAFVHVDADQYRSVKAACEVFGPAMVPGGVMWFDDYGCPTTPGATCAIDECFPWREITHFGQALVRFL